MSTDRHAITAAEARAIAITEAAAAEAERAAEAAERAARAAELCAERYAEANATGRAAVVALAGVHRAAEFARLAAEAAERAADAARAGRAECPGKYTERAYLRAAAALDAARLSGHHARHAERNAARTVTTR